MTGAEELRQRLILQGIRLWPQDGKLRYAGPQHRVTPEVLAQLKENKDALLDCLSTPTFSPTSHGQAGLWTIHQQQPGNSAYNLSFAHRIRSGLERSLFRDIVQLLVDRHPALRTRFVWREGALLQQVDGYQAAAVETVDVAGGSGEELAQRLQAFHDRPFDLGTGPLLRAAIFPEASGSHAVILTGHHIVLDGWSVYQLLDELFTLYAALHWGLPADLPIIRHTYDEFVTWQRDLLEREGTRLQAYWEKLLCGKLPTLELPADHARPPQPSLEGISLPLHLPSALCDQLKTVAREQGCTLYVVLLAAYQILLHRYSGQEEVLVGLPMAGRSRPEFAEVVGYFASPVVARAGFGDDPGFTDFLARTKRQVLASLDHQDYPFSLLVERLNPERDVSRMPIFQASFVLQKAHRAQGLVQTEPARHHGLEIEGIPIAYSAGQEDLAVMLSEREGTLNGYFQASADIFDETTLSRMARHFGVLLEDIASGTDRPISRLRLLDEEERRQVLVDWTPPRTEAPLDLCAHLTFEEMAARAPDAVAVIDGDRQLSYGELNIRVNRLAHHLRHSFDVGPGSLVAVALERSCEMVVCLLAILKGGAAYLPLDPDYPPEHLAYLLGDSEAAVLLTRQHLADLFSQSTVAKCFIDNERHSIASRSGGNPPRRPDLDDLAYVIYTSGSTGQPKGVMIEHRALAGHLPAVRAAYDITPKDRVLQFASFGFDAAQEQILAALTSGAALVLRGKALWTVGEFSHEVALRGITVADLPPAYFQQLVTDWRRERPSFLDGQLRLIVLGGEPVRPELLRSWFQVAAHRTRLVNAYGPTEATITATLCDLGAMPGDALPPQLPIGRPLPRRAAYVLDPSGQPAPIGCWGELYLGGDGLARGYLNRPELTAQKFVDAPFPDGGRLYRTGDRVRWLPDGQLAFLGRDDQQVKIRGFRVELGEVERALMQHPGIADAAVVAQEDEGAELRLVAFAVPKEPVGPAPDYRTFLQGKLPHYMLPAQIVAVDALPLTPHGKVDRAALLAARRLTSPCAFPPRTITEQRVAAIWRDVLRRDTLDVRDDFFAVGGHSILAVRLMREIQERFQVTLPLAALFQFPTVELLSRLLEEQDRGTLWSPLVPIRPRGSNPPLFCVHGIDGSVMNFHALASALSDHQPVYGLQSIGLDGETPPLTAVETMAAAYVRAIRALQPAGPYFLAGHSFGGEVAFEMARQLQELGEEVGLLALIDSYAPGTLPEEIYGIDETARFILAARYVGIAQGGAPIPVSAEELEGLSREERLQYLTERLRISGAWAPGLRVCLANLETRYRPPASIAVPTVVFHATGMPAGLQLSEDSLGWRSRVASPIAAHTVPGDHFNVLKDPWVRHWAPELQRRLDEAGLTGGH